MAKAQSGTALEPLGAGERGARMAKGSVSDSQAYEKRKSNMKQVVFTSLENMGVTA
eukprot:CAMPEP_0204119760 /NCGR_PEP_ID=MMETSP0361-20130328/7289_1 /ASSEMBLY_ACC=CAM_ASM_000343 /TAXON_ID=268821 /ORGANISM="Scrippsiella Hangoei, Strain SHTV-5" /LENGTH=55 /DNA_ID=CAMNT_0051070931 /DNA_START=197 /DNA_END=365 /DNA_ORIENTATION=+